MAIPPVPLKGELRFKQVCVFEKLKSYTVNPNRVIFIAKSIKEQMMNGASQQKLNQGTTAGNIVN